MDDEPVERGKKGGEVMMKLMNDEGTDFSGEVVLQIALMLEMINAAHLIAFRLDRILGNNGLKSQLIRERKLALAEAQKAARRVVSQFNVAFEGVFDQASKGESLRHDAINSHSVDIIETLLEYYNVVEVNDSNRERVKKSIRRLKGAGYPISEIMEYYSKV